MRSFKGIALPRAELPIFAIATASLLLALTANWILRGYNVWKNTEYEYAVFCATFADYSRSNHAPWCEKPRWDNLLREPSNAISSYAYLIVALLMT